jgi:hypothetical protein
LSRKSAEAFAKIKKIFLRSGLKTQDSGPGRAFAISPFGTKSAGGSKPKIQKHEIFYPFF